MRLVAVILASLLFLGCFVFDEIDKGMDLLEQHSPKREKEEAPARSWQGSPKKRTTRSESQGWWSRARSLAPGSSGEGKSDIVRCEIGASVQYTSEANCKLRGGRAARR